MKNNDTRQPMGGKLCTGGEIRLKDNRVVLERTGADSTTVQVPEGHAVTVGMKRETTTDETAVCFENSTRGWIVTAQGYGALLHMSPGDWMEFTAVNNALALEVTVGEVWDVVEVRALDAA